MSTRYLIQKKTKGCYQVILFQTKIIIVDNFWSLSFLLKVYNIDYHEDCWFQTKSSNPVLMFSVVVVWSVGLIWFRMVGMVYYWLRLSASFRCCDVRTEQKVEISRYLQQNLYYKKEERFKCRNISATIH